MTHTQLKSFLAIARYRSFTAAADQLYISQSALSQQMKSLEQELGFTLFDRGSRQLALTEAGRSFYQSALKIQEVYFHAVSEGQQLQRLHQQQLERLCIGCLGGQYFQIWMELLHTALPLLNRYAPRPVRYESKDALYTALLRGEAQIAALLENADIARLGLQFLPFAQVPELCMPSFHSMDATTSPLLQKSSVRLEDLQELRIAFHHHPGSILYEDELRRCPAAARYPVQRPCSCCATGLAGRCPTGLCHGSAGRPQGTGLCGVHQRAPDRHPEFLGAADRMTQKPRSSARNSGVCFTGSQWTEVRTKARFRRAWAIS